MSVASAETNDICSVCYNDFNKSTRLPTECPYCHMKICRTCLQTYVLNDLNDLPKCVNTDCSNYWNRDFLDGEFTRTFRLSTYKEHREKVLCDREKARLPATQEEASAYKQAADRSAVIMKQKVELEKQLHDLQRKIGAIMFEENQLQRTITTYGRVRGVVAAGGAGATAAPAAERAQFIKPCPAEGCKGFLSAAWKCGLCHLWTCPDCHELKGATRDVEHTCDPDKVASARLIASESRPCPKCGVSICKIDGCDQMFCTVCNTGFSWKTGKIVEGVLHNPHYFQWLRTRGAGEGEGEAVPGRAAGGAGRVCDADIDARITHAVLTQTPNPYGYGGYGYGHRYITKKIPTDTDSNYLAEVWRIRREYQDPTIRHNVNYEEKFRALRVRYMAGELSEDEWKTHLQRTEKDLNFEQAVDQIREVFTNATLDIVRPVLNADHNKAEIRKQLKEMIDYCNTCFQDISKRFGRKTSKIEIKLAEGLKTTTG